MDAIKKWFRPFGSPVAMFVWCGANAQSAFDGILRGSGLQTVVCIVIACWCWKLGRELLNEDIERFIQYRDAQRGK